MKALYCGSSPGFGRRALFLMAVRAIGFAYCPHVARLQTKCPAIARCIGKKQIGHRGFGWLGTIHDNKIP
jgi:hypothetical protein